VAKRVETTALLNSKSIQLRISGLTVLLGLLAGTLLAGITGALAALPIIASYSAIERIWLRRFLRDGAAEKHTEQKNQEFGEKT
jgi:predicted PurR-regulated permease PerM